MLKYLANMDSFRGGGGSQKMNHLDDIIRLLVYYVYTVLCQPVLQRFVLFTENMQIVCVQFIVRQIMPEQVKQLNKSIIIYLQIIPGLEQMLNYVQNENKIVIPVDGLVCKIRISV